MLGGGLLPHYIAKACCLLSVATPQSLMTVHERVVGLNLRRKALILACRWHTDRLSNLIFNVLIQVESDLKILGRFSCSIVTTRFPGCAGFCLAVAVRLCRFLSLCLLVEVRSCLLPVSRWRIRTSLLMTHLHVPVTGSLRQRALPD